MFQFQNNAMEISEQYIDRVLKNWSKNYLIGNTNISGYGALHSVKRMLYKAWRAQESLYLFLTLGSLQVISRQNLSVMRSIKKLSRNVSSYALLYRLTEETIFKICLCFYNSNC